MLALASLPAVGEVDSDQAEFTEFFELTGEIGDDTDHWDELAGGAIEHANYIDFFTFLGEMGDDAQEWEEFIDIAAAGEPPVFAETDDE